MGAKLKKILVFSPHPDDSDFGVAGTIAKLAKEGYDITLCVITDGRRGVPLSTKKAISIRSKEQLKAAKILGIKKVIFLKEEDGNLENTPKVREKLVRVIRQEKPDIIFSFDPANLEFDSFYRFHRDHRIVAEAVFDAVYPEAGSAQYYPYLIKQGLKPHPVREIWFFATHKPNKFIDISPTMNLKIKALAAHKSQVRNIKEVSTKIKMWAKKAGATKKMQYVECFRKINLTL